MSDDALRRDPFGVSCDARWYIPRQATEEALDQISSYLRVGATQIALVGPAGIGKTLLLRVMAGRLEGAMQVVDVPYPSLPADEIASWILSLMGAAPSQDAERALVQRARQIREEGSGLVILLDDAASTPLPTLRRLSRIAREARPSLHLILVVPDDHRAEDILSAVGPDVEVVRFDQPMTDEETRSYVDGRLARACADPTIRRRFDEEAIDEIVRDSQGLTAEVNRAARRWWIQLTGLRAEEPRKQAPAGPADPLPTSVREDAHTTALGTALLANARPIDLEDPFAAREDSPSEAPTEILEVPPAAARAPAPRAPERPPIAQAQAQAQGADAKPAFRPPAEGAPPPPSPVAERPPEPVAERAPEPAAGGPPRTEPPVRPAPEPPRRAARPQRRAASRRRSQAAAQRRVGTVLAAAALVGGAFLIGRWTSQWTPAEWRREMSLERLADREQAAPEGVRPESLREGGDALAGQAPPEARAPSATAQEPAVPAAPGSPVGPDVARAPGGPEQAGSGSERPAPEPVTARNVASVEAPVEVPAEARVEAPQVAEGGGAAEAPVDTDAGAPASAPAVVAAPVGSTPDVASAPPADDPGAGTGTDTGAAGSEARPEGTEPPPVLVSINAVPWARIEIDGADAGLTPLADVPLEPGEHEFRAVFGDGREVVRSETVDSLNRRILFR